MTNLSPDRPAWRAQITRERVLLLAPALLGCALAGGAFLLIGLPMLGRIQEQQQRSIHTSPIFALCSCNLIFVAGWQRDLVRDWLWALEHQMLGPGVLEAARPGWLQNWMGATGLTMAVMLGW